MRPRSCAIQKSAWWQGAGGELRPTRVRSTSSVAPYLGCTLQFMGLSRFRSEILTLRGTARRKEIYYVDVDAYIHLLIHYLYIFR